jgi:hypothetical protein
MKKKKVLVVVAHPDDETIWMGGTLIRNIKNWDTTIICLCRKYDKDRAPKFKRVCKILKVKGYMENIDDKKFYSLKNRIIIKEILKTAKKEYDILFTHGKNGEYGHIRHLEIHNAVKEILVKKFIRVKKVFFFSYTKKKNKFQGYSIYNSSANKFIRLNHNELLLKKHLIKDVYGYIENGFEEKSSGNIEAFDIK